MVQREDEVTRQVREKTKQAIAMAMGGGWEAASKLNREIIDLMPEDADAWNRLGKALIEMGNGTEARDAFLRVLQLAPSNTIARKNLQRCEGLPATPTATPKKVVSAKAFISDSGKSAQVTLLSSPPASERPMVGAGETVLLSERNGTLAVHDQDNNLLGLVPPIIGSRLIRLAQGGNVYEGAVSSASGDSVRVVLWETYQDPSQRSTVSFPAQGVAAPTATKESAPAWEPQMWSGVHEDDMTGMLVGSGVSGMLDGGIPDDSYYSEED